MSSSKGINQVIMNKIILDHEEVLVAPFLLVHMVVVEVEHSMSLLTTVVQE